MNDGQRMFGLILDALITGLAFWRLHRTHIKHPPFVLYLAIMLAFGWLLCGDIGYHSSWLDFGDLERVGFAIRGNVARVFVLIGLIYVVMFGNCRKKGE